MSTSAHQPASPLPDDYLREIGLISVRWNQLELVMQQCLIEVLGLDFSDRRSHVIFVNISFTQRLNALSALLGEWNDTAADTVRRLYESKVKTQVAKASEGRNIVVHANWSTLESGEIERFRITAKGLLKFHIELMPIEQLRGITDQIIDAGDALYKLIVARGDSEMHTPQTGQ